MTGLQTLGMALAAAGVTTLAAFLARIRGRSSRAAAGRLGIRREAARAMASARRKLGDFPPVPDAPPEALAPTGRNAAKGREGEAAVREVLARAGLFAMHDVTMPSPNGRTTQVDHIVVVGRSLVCLETKSWAGAISGGHGDALWTQSFPGSPDRHEYANPIRQNEWHELAVRLNVRRAFREAGLDYDVRGFVVMADVASTILSSDRRKLTTVESLDACLRTVAWLGDDGNELRRWRRLGALAHRSRWTVGDVTLPSWALH